MNIYSNKWFLVGLSSVLLILIVMLLFPNIFQGAKKMVQLENPEITQIKTQSKDNGTDAIKKDLDNTNVENADREMKQIEVEIDAAL